LTATAGGRRPILAGRLRIDGMSKPRSQQSAFTVLEVLAVVIIIAILVVLAAPQLQSYLGRAQEAKCTANMRSIITALGSYLPDHSQVWPQAPSIEQEKAWEAFWLEALQPYDIDARTWQCPTLWPQTSRDPALPQVHYIPMAFGPEPGIAYRWATQPWLIERANGHSQGPLIGFQDGSIKPFYKVLAEQGQL